MNFLTHISMFFVLSFQGVAIELVLGKELESPNGPPKYFSETSIEFPAVGRKLLISTVNEELIISSDDGSILFAHPKGYVSTVDFSGKFACLHIREGDERSSSSVGVLILAVSDGVVYSRLIDIRKLSFVNIESARVTRVLGFKYPLAEVVVGVKKEGRKGGFWNAKLKVGPSLIEAKTEEPRN